MNRANLPSPEAIRRLCGTQPKPAAAPERKRKTRKSDRLVLVVSSGMLEAVREYKYTHDLPSDQAAMRKLLAIALDIEWEAELNGMHDVQPPSPFSQANREQIKSRYLAGEKLVAIAADLGISKSYASAIKDGKR